MELFIIIASIFIIVCYFTYIFSSNKRTERLLKKYSKVRNSCELTGGDFIMAAFEVLGYSDCEVQYSDKKNTDCYIPKFKLIVLNKEYCFKASLSALGVAAHELGHCIQHKENKIIYVVTGLFRIISKLAKIFCLPVFLASIYFILTYQFYYAGILLLSGFVCLILSIAFNLLTIPCEFNASQIGIKFLKKHNLIKPSEEREIRKILKTAGNTYIASFYRSVGIKNKK